MKKLNHKGFSGIEALLVLVSVAIVGFAGWYVWHSKNNANSSYNNSGNSNTYSAKKKTATKTVTDPTADWISYSSKEGKFSLKYPKTWVTAANAELCAPGLLLIAPTSSSLGKCGSDSVGEVEISSIEGDQRSSYMMNTGYTNHTKESVTVSGVVGTKESGVAKDQPMAIGHQDDGTIVVQYLFYANSKTYIAVYVKTAKDPDALNDFNLLVTKTLKFE